MKEKAVSPALEEIKDTRWGNWRHNAAIGALVLSVLTGACENYKSDDDAPEPPNSDMQIDVNLRYRPEDYSPDSNGLRIPNSYEECAAHIAEQQDDVSQYEDLLLYLAGSLQLTQEAWPYIVSGMHFYCDTAALDRVCTEEDEESTGDPHTYVAGCHESWSDDQYYYSVMHVPLDENIQLITSHELLHAIETEMTGEEWWVISELLETAFWQLDQKEFNALVMAGALVPFSIFETDNQNEVLAIDFVIDFYDEAQVQEFYALVGTTFSSLPADLEKHYARYFIDRQAVVRMHWESLDVDYFMQLQDN